MGYDILFDIPKERQIEIQEGELGSKYRIVNEEVKARSPSCWFTNLDIKKRHEDILLWKEYTPEEYPKYDNYNAINVSKTANIPVDYFDVMGVPITFLDKYNPDQFEIIGLDRYVEDNPKPGHRFTINGKETYARIMIKRRTGGEK